MSKEYFTSQNFGGFYYKINDKLLEMEFSLDVYISNIRDLTREE